MSSRGHDARAQHDHSPRGDLLFVQGELGRTLYKAPHGLTEITKSSLSTQIFPRWSTRRRRLPGPTNFPERPSYRLAPLPGWKLTMRPPPAVSNNDVCWCVAFDLVLFRCTMSLSACSTRSRKPTLKAGRPCIRHYVMRKVGSAWELHCDD